MACVCGRACSHVSGLWLRLSDCWPGRTLSVSARLDPAGNLVLEVADTGIFIAQKDIEKVMAPFGQVETDWSRKVQGTGLGLPLSKRLFEAHGGTLTLTSEQGVGTRATVVLPKSRLEAWPLTLLVNNSEVRDSSEGPGLGGNQDEEQDVIETGVHKRAAER